MNQPTFNMDHQWLPFTANRQFRQDPRVIVAAEGLNFTTHDGQKNPGRYCQPVVCDGGP